jgi:hypothetical protein
MPPSPPGAIGIGETAMPIRFRSSREGAHRNHATRPQPASDKDPGTGAPHSVIGDGTSCGVKPVWSGSRAVAHAARSGQSPQPPLLSPKSVKMLYQAMALSGEPEFSVERGEHGSGTSGRWLLEPPSCSSNSDRLG